ncbi:hypothetical protein [Catenovulum sediminis]|uniref:hypothetical protein n=1 Tax=Catenovulum sediminis TaxID=1740262 RepID=UPI001180ECF6|nr:hypothetical protein [Catenovulum sediminis]
MFTNNRIGTSALSENAQLNLYKHYKFSWWQCFVSSWMDYIRYLFLIGLALYSAFPVLELEFVLGALGLLGVFVVLRTKDWLESGQVLLSTCDTNIRLNNGKVYEWSEVASVEIPPLPVSPYGMPVPKYRIHFKDGRSFPIDQRLEKYTGLYHELYKRKISGAEKPLPMYEVELQNGMAPGGLKPKPVAIYYPDKNIEVPTEPKNSANVRRKRRKPASRKKGR